MNYMVQLIELGNRSLLKVLECFLKNPTTKIPYTGLGKKIKIAKATLTKHLNFLLKKNFIKVERIGLNKLYELNRANQIVKQFKILDNLMDLNEIRVIEEKYGVDIYLYGSASRGEDTETSDIDLLIIGEIDKEKIILDINNMSKQIKRAIKFVIFSPLEWSKLSRNDPAFYERVEKDRIRLH